MLNACTERRLSKGRRGARPGPGAASPPDGGERDAVLKCFQLWVDAGFANWRVNESGGRELHLANGKSFLLQTDGIVCQR